MIADRQLPDKKKIVLFTDWYEPGFKAGGPIQSCRNFAAAMQDRYQISIITSDRDLGDLQPYPGIVTDTWIDKGQGLRVWYAGPGSLTGSSIAALVRSAGPDYIYLNSMYSYAFTILPVWLKSRNKLPGKLILAPRGMLHEGAIRFKPLKKKLFIRLLNISGVVRRLIFQATDPQEKEDILKYFPGAGKVVVVPNFPRMEAVVWKNIRKQPGELRCIFISRLAPKKNLLFLLTVLQQLPAGIRLVLTLRGEVEDDAYWKKCLSLIESMPPGISVRREGPIRNDEVTGVLQEHHIFVLPTLGENFGHAIFEALLAGKPVLISDKTPWLQLGRRKAGYDLPLDAKAFSDALVSLASMDQAVYDEWSKAAFGYAQTIQQDSSLKKEYEDLFA
ncbi:MAG TPA: glycosyltransferase family 4 protein [Puia sp.]|jgi:glycosyltransferase involved in cell wall biosynthesis